ncbi:MAG TPA: hypothetical protein VEH84_06960 [Alphaproteobacteria bacterium]|nr:hypothetical protein [Alphaproteobacteria bacterium]
MAEDSPAELLRRQKEKLRRALADLERLKAEVPAENREALERVERRLRDALGDDEAVDGRLD